MKHHDKDQQLPLGGEFGKSRVRTNFIQKTPNSYGVPAIGKIINKCKYISCSKNLVITMQKN